MHLVATILLVRARYNHHPCTTLSKRIESGTIISLGDSSVAASLSSMFSSWQVVSDIDGKRFFLQFLARLHNVASSHD